MKERIKEIMEAERLTPSLFADKLNIGRAVISHILNGRNNPSLDVVTRILETLDYIDADWLLSGKGTMRKSDNLAVQLGKINPITPPNKSIATDLFDTKVEQHSIPSIMENIPISRADTQQSTEDKNTHNPVSHPPATFVTADKKISKVIIYYSDNTFQAFNPDNTSL